MLRENILSHTSPFEACHASTVAKTSEDCFIAAWFGGTAEGDKDVCIWQSVKKDGIWSSPSVLAKVNEEPHWNPVLFAEPDGGVILFFKTGQKPENWLTWRTVSYDEGKTWSPPVLLDKQSDAPVGPVKNKPILSDRGTLLAPNSIATESGEWDVILDSSEDGGITWEHHFLPKVDHSKFKGRGVIQPSLWINETGHVHMLMRSTCDYLCRSESKDNGQTWTAIEQTRIPNPDSGFDLIGLSGGPIVMLFTPSPIGSNLRYPLVLAVSLDNGESWPYRIDLETEKGEFSYPAIVADESGVAFTYTWNRKNIVFCRYTLDEIIANSIPVSEGDEEWRIQSK